MADRLNETSGPNGRVTAHILIRHANAIGHAVGAHRFANGQIAYFDLHLDPGSRVLDGPSEDVRLSLASAVILDEGRDGIHRGRSCRRRTAITDPVADRRYGRGGRSGPSSQRRSGRRRRDEATPPDDDIFGSIVGRDGPSEFDLPNRREWDRLIAGVESERPPDLRELQLLGWMRTSAIAPPDDLTGRIAERVEMPFACSAEAAPSGQQSGSRRPGGRPTIQPRITLSDNDPRMPSAITTHRRKTLTAKKTVGQVSNLPRDAENRDPPRKAFAASEQPAHTETAARLPATPGQAVRTKMTADLLADALAKRVADPKMSLREIVLDLESTDQTLRQHVAAGKGGLGPKALNQAKLARLRNFVDLPEGWSK